MCDGFSAHKYFIDDTFLFMKTLYLVLNGILNLCYDAEHKIHFISSNTSIKEIANRKTWLSGSEYQIEHIYEYKKGNLLYKDLKIFTFSVGENISIKDILLHLIKTSKMDIYDKFSKNIFNKFIFFINISQIIFCYFIFLD